MNIALLNTELVKDKYLNEIIYFEELDSTNSYAKKNNLGSDTLLITSNQLRGTGRFNRQWKTTPSKDLTFSLIKNIDIRIDEVHLVNFYSSYILLISLKEYLSSFNIQDISLKWPNDIIFNGRKIAGILLDVKDLKNDLKKFIIGIGLNVNSKEFPEDLKPKATSIINEIKSELNIEMILIIFIKNFFEKLYLIKSKDELMKNWLMHTKIVGKKINFRKIEDDKEQPATVINIDPDGGLKVKFEDDRIKKYYSGEISLLYN
ncbi:MAG: biotin--[acetyl-CoA-carboxylase] ligase [Ignavibacteria bacterium]|nr:biotin--[acetyl-CoA-carboxylase] ligase [Ignavibacteria bacterium]